MARDFARASSDLAYFDPMPYGGLADFCCSVWLRKDDAAASILFEYDQTNGFDYIFQSFPPGDLTRSYVAAGGWSDNVTTPASVGVWHHHFLIIPCGGEGVPPPSPLGQNRVWIDGVAQVLAVNSHVTAGAVAASAPFTVCGRRVGGVNSPAANAAVAEMALWSSHDMLANPTPYINALAAGACPIRVRVTEIIMYVPYLGGDSPEPDFHGQSRNFTLAGAPTFTAHPPTARSLVNWQD